MTKTPISRYPLPELKDLPKDVSDMIIRVHDKAGFVPNVFAALAHRPDELRAFFVYHDALMERVSGLSKAEMEMIVVAISADNNCMYCVVAHGAILRIRAKKTLIADQIAINYKKADLSHRHKGMLDFALKVSNDSASIDAGDFNMLRHHGFDEEDAWDIAAITAFFGLSNRMANFAAIRPNEEFHIMARTEESVKDKKPRVVNKKVSKNK